MPASSSTYRPDVEAAYADNFAYLSDELRKLDALLRLRVAAFRQRLHDDGESSGHHLFVSHEEIDAILSRNSHRPAGDEGELLRDVQDVQRRIEERISASLEAGVFLSLPRLARMFGLSGFEVQVVLICLAPELRRDYDRVYAYLQDDITRKRPSVDLVLDLLCGTESDRWRARPLLAEHAPLLRSGILEPVDDLQSPSGSSGLAQFLQLTPRILNFILGQNALDERLRPIARVVRYEPPLDEPVPAAARLCDDLLPFVRRNFAGDDGPQQRLVIHLTGPYGVGRRDVALAICDALRCPLLRFDAALLPSSDGEAEELLERAFRESVLLQAPIYVEGADVFLGDDRAALRAALRRAADAYAWLTFLADEKPWPYRELFDGMLFYSVPMRMPDVQAREEAWHQSLRSVLPEAPADALAPGLAARYKLTPLQIHRAATVAAHRRTVDGNGQPVTFAELAGFCRAGAHHHLGTLATKIDPHYDWSHLVLPDDQLTQLQEMCSHVRNQHVVFRRWGFQRKLSHGRGLSALFTGPPGTGKTMAAEVVARELEVDLFKIDLARVVSKYIGETERNLSRVFDEAENSNAILFFDEADALFGKRTDISDAHDRYANIETSYLLQKMEEYEGVVILASNLRENMDSAFLRRIRFVVEFPFPDTESRRRIWKTHFPTEAPVSADLDYQLLAERVQVAGGNIKNIVLNAAFYAAADGGVIDLDHVVRGTRREFEKIGKLWDEQVLARPSR